MTTATERRAAHFDALVEALESTIRVLRIIQGVAALPTIIDRDLEATVTEGRAALLAAEEAT